LFTMLHAVDKGSIILLHLIHCFVARNFQILNRIIKTVRFGIFCCNLAVPMTPCWGPRCSQIWPFVLCREPIPINNNGADRTVTP
jgi:hypothetical protein